MKDEKNPYILPPSSVRTYHSEASIPMIASVRSARIESETHGRTERTQVGDRLRIFHMATDLRLKEQLSALTGEIVDTYEETAVINHLGHAPLPHSGTIVDLLHDLKEVLFPGYRRRQNLHAGNVTYYVGDLLDSIHDRLTDQIARALRYGDELQGKTCATRDALDDFELRGQQQTIEFLKSLPKLRRILATDVQAAFDGDPARVSLCVRLRLAGTIGEAHPGRERAGFSENADFEFVG